MIKYATIITLVFLAVFCYSSETRAAMVGPYTGQVVDAETDRPIEGASVFMFWMKRIPLGFEMQTELEDAQLKYTDKKGKYYFTVKFTNDYLDSVNIIVYEPGYQAYIKRNWFNNPYSKPEQEFSAQDQAVKLQRLPANFDYGKHYEAVEQALWGVNDFYLDQNAQMTWEQLLKNKLKTVPEKAEFLRRIEWEERRFREDLEK